MGFSTKVIHRVWKTPSFLLVRNYPFFALKKIFISVFHRTNIAVGTGLRGALPLTPVNF